MEKTNLKLSVALAVLNEEQNIEACLQSVANWVDEIVVVDGGSKDKTVEIAKKYTNTIIKTDNPSIFHINKQKALDACKGVWILQLDADEVVTKELKQEILDTIRVSSMNGYYIARRNYFWGHFMKKGGQYPDFVIRLIRKEKAYFPCKDVHEQIIVEGDTGYLKEPMLHYSYKTKADYWKKADTYTTLSAMKLRETVNLPTIGLWFSYMVIQPMKTFFLLFLRHKGFLDGWYGFVFAYWSALHFPIAYKKFLKLV